MPHIRIRNLLIGSFVLIFALAACGPSGTREGSSGENSAVSAGVTSTENPSTSGELLAGSSSSDKFPLEPNPITITSVLDTELAVTNADTAGSGVGSGFVKNGTTAEGIPFTLMIDGGMFMPDAGGNLSLILGSIVTATPVSSITDLPFSQGYLAAVHLGPDGLLLEEPGSLSFELPGLYDESSLIGFAADGNGTDFHLFPVGVAALENTNVTDVYFDITRSGLYGVAQVTKQEIQKQLAHPPVNPGSQDDQELAALLNSLIGATLSEISDAIQLQVGKSHDRLFTMYLSDLEKLECNRVDEAAYQFIGWRSKAEKAQDMTENYDIFMTQITDDATNLLARLTECAKVTCLSCVNNTSGSKLDSASINQLLVHAAFAGDLSKILDDYDQYDYWISLSNKCAVDSGLPNLYGIGWGEGTQGSTAVPLVCRDAN